MNALHLKIMNSNTEIEEGTLTMDELNKLEIRRSEIRQRMNEISGLDDLSEGVIAEEEKLRDEYQKLEIRARAAKNRRRPGRQASKRGFPG